MLISAAVLFLMTISDGPDPVAVPAALETAPVANADDAADDPAVWIHPSDPALSLMIATDKQAGLLVYDTDGNLLQSIGDGRPNNVDMRHAVLLSGISVDLVASSDRADDAIALYRVDAASRRLEAIGRIQTDLPELYGICLALGPSREPFDFVNDKDGRIQQWSLAYEGGGPGRVRHFQQPAVPRQRGSVLPEPQPQPRQRRRVEAIQPHRG